jgi:hypothetical protein
MTIDSRASKWGYAILVFAAILFGIYWYIMLEPVQAAAIAKGKAMPMIIYILIGGVFGAVFGSLTSVGTALTKPKWFGISYEAKLGDIIDSKGVRKFVIICAIGFGFFSAFLPSNV